MFDSVKPNFLWDILRNILALLDRIVYQLLIWICELFFNVSESEIFSGSTIIKFFDRIFLIVGVFMLFKLAFSLLNSIVNPDMLTDKEKGFGKIITRSLIVIILIVILIPTGDQKFKNNPPTDEKITSTYDYKIKTHGLLFGTLYTLQDKVVKDNIIGKIVLGVSPNTTSESQQDDFKNVGSDMATTVLNAFFYPNADCKSTVEPIASLDEFMSKLNNECTITDGNAKRYSYSYMPLISTLVGGVLVFIILSFTIDIAIRTVKLGVLRLLAPIPIISYIDPKSAKDGAFANWVKNLTSTYLDLFLRLILIYFGIFLVSEVCQNIKVLLPKSASIIDILTQILLIIGIFFFIKMAPKFFKDIFGIKDQGNGSIGLAGMLGGAAALLGGAGLAGAGSAMIGNLSAASDAAAQGKSFGGGWSQGRDLAAQIRSGDKNARGGIMNKMQDRLMERANNRSIQYAENRAAKLGLTKENMDKQKDLINQADADFNKANYDYQHARDQYSNFKLADDPGQFTKAEPQYADYNNDIASYSAAHSSWQREKEQHAEQMRIYNESKAKRDQLQQDAQSAYDRMYEASNRKTKLERDLADAKEARGSLGPKQKKYSAQKPFEPGKK